MLSGQIFRRRQLLRRMTEALIGLGLLGMWTGLLMGQDGEPATASYLAQADSARMDNEERLKTALGTGLLKMSVHNAGEKQPLEITDAVIKVLYDSPKFLIEIDNRTRLRELQADAGQAGHQWKPTDVSKEAILFDGEALYQAIWDQAHVCRGEVYFAFSRQAVLRSAGFPFEHPIHIWREALNLSRVKAERTQVTPLRSGGFMAIETMSSYDTKFFIFDRFGYDLRRVSTQRTDNGLPIREYSLKWDESNGVFFLRQFTNTVTKMLSNPRTEEHEVVSKSTTTVEYDSFEVNLPIAANRFSVAAMGVPSGTRFVDKRRRTQRNPAILEFDGDNLNPVDPPDEAK